MKTKVIPASPKLQTTWGDLVASVDRAAAEYTLSGRLPLSPFYAHDLPGADAEIERVLRQTTQAEADYAAASFIRGPEGKLMIEIRWDVDPAVVKRGKK